MLRNLASILAELSVKNTVQAKQALLSQSVVNEGTKAAERLAAAGASPWGFAEPLQNKVPYQEARILVPGKTIKASRLTCSNTKHLQNTTFYK